jgi:predicted RNase H-like HicB family nuclease
MEQLKKDLKYYQRLPYSIIIERFVEDEIKYFTAEIKELRGCKTDGENEIEATANIHELFDEYITTHLEEGIEIPEPEKIIMAVQPIKARVWIKKQVQKPSITQDSEDTMVKSKNPYEKQIMASDVVFA